MAAAAPSAVNANQSPAVTAVVQPVRNGQPRQQRQLPEAGFDGVLVAGIGAGLTGAGWLLMLAGGRRLRRRSR